MFWNKYPYTDFHELNLDMILQMMRELHADWNEFKALNTITFDGPWNITHQYPTWTIVTDGPKSYISVKPVPAGVTIDNSEYWMVVVDYTDIFTDIETRLSNIEAEIEPIINRKYVFLGDSYNFWSGGWLTGVVSAMGLTDYYDVTVSGHGFTTSPSWQDDIIGFVNDNPDVATDITDVVIVGGINDATSAALADLSDAVTQFITFVDQHLPKAKITMCFVGSCQETSTYYSTHTYLNRLKAMQIEQDILEKDGHIFNAGSINALYSYSMFNADGLHPSTYGNQSGIIPAVCSALNHEDFEPTYAFNNGYELHNHGITETVIGGLNILKMGLIKIPDATVIDASGWVDVLTLGNNIIGKSHSLTTCFVDKLASTSEQLKCFARVYDGKVQLKSCETTNSYTYKSMTANNTTYLVFAEFIDPVQASV